ncbi:hypothetical protein [Limimaricola cinnabarinus]|uniref:hypothetical protein n=1 Tax=Limimaricola cinnabarinus TaxID=1125964 RepID=UPI002FE40268
MTGTYWNSTGTYQATLDKLWTLIPMYGDVLAQGCRLEKLRRAMLVYRDLHNNGLWNRFREVRTVLGVTPKHFGVHYRHQNGGLDCPEFLAAIESRVDQIVLEAADEQAIVIVELSAHQRMARFAASKKK